MSDLIDRDETIKQFCKQDCGCDLKDCLDKTCYEVEIIESVPTHPTSSNTLGTLDCVERQDAIDAVKFGITYAKAFNKSTGEVKELFKEGNKALNEAAERLKELPSVQPRRGKWIYGESEIGNDGYYCSKCGNFVPWKYGEYDIDFIKEFLFCNKCGSDMRPQFEEGEKELTGGR